MRSNMCGTVSKALEKSIYATSAVKLRFIDLMRFIQKESNWRGDDRRGRKTIQTFDIKLLDCRKCIKYYDYDSVLSKRSDRVDKQYIGR